MTIESAAGLVLALFVLCCVPGPGLLAITARSLTSGFKPAWGLAIGMTLGDLCYASAAMLGLAAMGRVMGEFFILVKLAGAGYLLWLGVQLLIRKPTDAQQTASKADKGFLRNLLAGYSICLGNPKVILFYLGFLPAFIDLQRLTMADGIIVGTLVAVVIGGTLTAYAYLATQVRRFFTSGRITRRLNQGAGMVMIGAGLAIASE